tara:strand:- start:2390 stop:4042 length:1653 start_codon:yes stop_codon:yes gene_type:complete
MAFKLADRVKETTTTTGTGNIALGGAITNFETFSANLSNSDTTYYAIVDNTNGAFEVGLGTYNSSGNTLSRSVIASSNSNSAVNLGVGTKEVFITAIADKIVMEDGSNNVSIGGTVTATAFSGSGAGLTGVDVVSDTTPQLGGDLDAQNKDIENVGLVESKAEAGIYGSSSSPVEFTVTVASKTSGHPYPSGGSSSGNAYFINGIESPAITLHGVDSTTSNSEYHYRFTLSSSDMTSHPFRLYLDAAKTTPYTTGVTTTSTYLQIAVTKDTPKILYYQCSSHGYMGNYAIVLGSTNFADGNITNVGDISLDSISPDGTDINVAVSDNSATAFTIKQGSDNYLVVDTGNSGESVAIGTGVSGTAVSIGHSTSETTVNDNLTVTGDLTVNGTTTTVNSTTLTVDDPIITLGGDTAPGSDDNKDRGVEFRYHTGSAAKVGFFGFDDDTGKFTFIPDATNNSEVFSGSAGTVVANLEGNVTATTISLGGSNLTTTATLSTGISNGNVLVATSGVVDNDFLRVDGTSVEGRSASEVADDIGAATKGFATAMAIAL